MYLWNKYLPRVAPEVEFKVISGDCPVGESDCRHVELQVRAPWTPFLHFVRSWRYWRAASAVYERWPYDIIVFNDRFQAAAPLMFGLYGVRIAALINDDNYLRPRRRDRESLRNFLGRLARSHAEKLIQRRVDLTIVCSKYLARQIHEARGGTLPSVLQPALDREEFAQSILPSQVKVQANDQRLPSLLWLKAAAVRGGVFDILDALSDRELAGRFAGLTIAGFDGPVRSEVERRGSDLGLAIRTLGPLSRKQVLQELVSHDIGVFASRQEAFGLGAREFAAAGMTVVASDAGGISEALEGLSAYRFRAKSVADLRRALGRAAGSPLTNSPDAALARDARDMTTELLELLSKTAAN